jgi:hypothetical protein
MAHGVLAWLVLAVARLQPWRWRRFSDYAVDRVFLRRAGGGLSITT